MRAPHGDADAGVTFSVVADVEPGASVRAVGSIGALGHWQPERGAELLRVSASVPPRWSTTLRIPGGLNAWNDVEYKFVKVLRGRDAVWEDCDNRRIRSSELGSGSAAVPRFSERTPNALGARLAQAAAASVAPGAAPSIAPSMPSAVPSAVPSIAPAVPSLAASDGEDELQWEVTCAVTRPGDRLVLVGSCTALGDWSPARGLEFTTSASLFPRWIAKARLRPQPVEWKIVICRAGEEEWEQGPNRRTALAPGQESRSWLVQVHFGGACGEPELRTPQKRAASNPTVPSAPSIIPGLRRQNTDLGNGASSTPVSSTAATPGRTRLGSQDDAVGRRASQDSSRRDGGVPAVSSGHRRTASATALGDLEAVISSVVRQASHAGEQVVILRLEGIPSDEAARYVVEVNFEAQGASRRRLLHVPSAADRRPTEARWSMDIAEAQLRPGIHSFYFLVNGVRVLSADHPVIGEFNALLVSEPMRKYVSSRESDLGAGGVVAASTWHPASLSQGENPQSGNSVDDGAPDRPKGAPLARAWSICNIVSMGDDDDDDPMEVAHKNAPSFGKEVFEGIFDAELRLRMDGYVLPEAATAQKVATAGPLRFEAGAALLKKKLGPCEDAYFKSSDALGVADGVGCMVQFASYGVNAAAYAAELMASADAALRPGGAAAVGAGAVEERARAALAEAEDSAKTYGASTICVLAMEDNSVGVANLGDSGFMHLRKAAHGWQVVKKSEEQQHSWNCPYQLTRLPPALISRFPKLTLDKVADSETYVFDVCQGDLVLVFSDGLHDNLHEREILYIVDCALSPTFADLMGMREYATDADRIARALALAAQERSLDTMARVPFVEYSRRHGYEVQGGKPDDITVVAAWVVPEHRAVPTVPDAAKANAPPPQEPEARAAAAVEATASLPEAPAAAEPAPAAAEPPVAFEAAAADSAPGPAAAEVASSVEKCFTDGIAPIPIGGAKLEQIASPRTRSGPGGQASFQAQAGRYQTGTATNGSARKPHGGGRAEFRPMSSSKSQVHGPGKGAGKGAGGGRGRGAGRGGEPHRPPASAR